MFKKSAFLIMGISVSQAVDTQHFFFDFIHWCVLVLFYLAYTFN